MWLLFSLFLAWSLWRILAKEKDSGDIEFFPDEVGCGLAPRKPAVSQEEIAPAQQAQPPTESDSRSRDL
jgi:hypothetical protein